MKKALRLYDGRTLSATQGKPNTYAFKQAVVSTVQRGNATLFSIKVLSRSGHETTETPELREMLDIMRSFAPDAAWRLNKVEKPKRQKKMKVVSGIKGRG